MRSRILAQILFGPVFDDDQCGRIASRREEGQSSRMSSQCPTTSPAASAAQT